MLKTCSLLKMMHLCLDPEMILEAIAYDLKQTIVAENGQRTTFCDCASSSFACSGNIERKRNTRKYSSMMRTASLETVRASVSVTTNRCHSMVGGGESQINKFEQVSSDHHLMSLAGGPGSDV